MSNKASKRKIIPQENIFCVYLFSYCTFFVNLRSF